MYRVGVLIAAAGQSQRMGRPKALLQTGKTTFVEHLIDVFSSTQISSIIVTIPEGPNAVRVRESVVQYPVTPIVNHWPHLQLFGSIRSALRLSSSLDALIVCPVDNPFITPALVRRLISELRNRRQHPTVVVPCHQDRWGHPVGISSAYFRELMLKSWPMGLKGFLQAHIHDVVFVPWHDERIACNINTPGDYNAFFKKPALRVSNAALAAVPGSL